LPLNVPEVLYLPSVFFSPVDGELHVFYQESGNAQRDFPIFRGGSGKKKLPGGWNNLNRHIFKDHIRNLRGEINLLQQIVNNPSQTEVLGLHADLELIS
jgi:hypothetical protein